MVRRVAVAEVGVSGGGTTVQLVVLGAMTMDMGTDTDVGGQTMLMLVEGRTWTSSASDCGTCWGLEGGVGELPLTVTMGTVVVDVDCW
jgi:hypothetical protein